MDGPNQVIVVPIIFIFITLILMIPLFTWAIHRSSEQVIIRDSLIDKRNRFVRGNEVPPVVFNDIRQLTLKKHMHQKADEYECEGIFVIAIYDEKRFYCGESKRLFNSINLQLSGRGNKELYKDLLKNGVIWIRAYSYNYLSDVERSNIKEKLIEEYSTRGLYQYGKKKPVEAKTHINKADDNGISYLNHELSVTRMAKIVKQPKGGYIKPSELEKNYIEYKKELEEGENVSPILVGLAVDYLSRMVMGDSKDNAFQISLLGAGIIDNLKLANFYLSNINGLDDNSIVSAIKLVSYDCVFRAGAQAYVDQSDIKPNNQTIENIREMVNRTVEFWKQYGPITIYGPTFEGGYTKSISTGDGDYVTADTIWDYKVSKNTPTNKYTFQLLLYYILGLHSIHEEYKNIKYLGIYNPRLNVVYRYKIENISKEVIEDIEKNIIGY